MASVASAANKYRTLVFCTQRLKGPSLSVLRQQLASTHQESSHSDNLCTKRSFSKLHEQGRRTKSTSSVKISSGVKRDSDLVVVLDLDECLIHSKFLNRMHSTQYAYQVPEPLEHASEQEDSLETFHIALPDGELARVYQRPYLQDFLHAVSSKYETHLFTAGQQVYAQSILQHLDPDNSIFANCLYREACTYDPLMKAHVKDLGQHFPDSIHKTVLVDNNHLSFLANPQNGILVTNFFDDPKDTTLLAVLDLLQELEQEQDVRPLLDERFQLSDFLKKRQQHEEAKFELRQKEKQEQDKIMESTEQLLINVSVWDNKMLRLLDSFLPSIIHYSFWYTHTYIHLIEIIA